MRLVRCRGWFFLLVVCAAPLAVAGESVQRAAISSLVKDHRCDLARLFYESKAMGKEQAFCVFVPATYDPKVAKPVVVFLHSWYTDFHDKQWLRVAEIPGTIQAQCNERGWVAVGPEGGGNNWYYGKAEEQVLETVDHLKKYVNIDTNRLILVGRSMGGAGALTIAMHHPDRVVGVVSLAGVSDYVEFALGNKELLLADIPGSVKTSFGGLPDQQKDTYRSMGAVHHVDVLKKMPVYLIHGAEDTVVPASHSRKLAEQLKKAGGNVAYVEAPKQDHNMEMIEWYAPQYFKFLETHAKLGDKPGT